MYNGRVKTITQKETRIMAKSFNKMVKEIEAKEKANKAKVPYVQPLRPRATVFKTGKEYSRQKAKQETKKMVANW